MIKLYKKYLSSYILLFIFLNYNCSNTFAQNPRIRVDYKVTQGKMTSTTSAGCDKAFLCEANGLEIAIHPQFKSSTGPASGQSASYGCASPAICPCTTSSGAWSCEFRTESFNNLGTCDVWFNNSPSTLGNTSYSNDPGYMDTSAYPCNDIINVRMKAYESDGPGIGGTQCKAPHDGICGAGTFGTQGPVDTGTDNLLVDIGATTNTLAPHKGSVWSTTYESGREGCTSDGITNNYYFRWRFRWCWDSTTLNNTHAGLIKTPSTLYICSGSTATINDSSEAFEAARGFSDYQWQYSTNGTTWIDIAGATTKDLSTTVLTNTTTAPITYQLRRVGLFCTDFKSAATYRRYPVYSNIQNIIVYPQPIAPTLNSETPTNGSTICKGTFVYAQVNGGTGGFTDATNEYQFSLNNGTSWSAYAPPSGINTTTATGTILVRARRTGGSLSGCTASAWSTIASWNISTITPPSLNTANPANNSAICTPYDVSATFNAGSGGGTSDEFIYSINNGSSWNTYTPGSTINTTGATTKIIIQGRRTGGPAPCNTPPYSTLVEWTPIAQVINPTLASKTPNKDSLCETETNVSANFNIGSGGSSFARDSFQVSVDNGLSWNNYIANATISILSSTDSVLIRGMRIDINALGCAENNWDTLHKWYVQKLPSGTPVVDKIYLCDATAKLRVSNLTPNNSSVVWTRSLGTHTPISTTDTTFVVSGIGTSAYNLKISNGVCSNISAGNVSVTTNLITPTSNISTTDNCQYCIVQDDSTKLFFDINGDLVAEIKDLNIPSTFLDETEICMRIDPTQQHVIDNFGDNQPYLKRQWTITPKNNNTNVEVTLYFTETELNDLRNACLSGPYQFSNYDKLMITKYYGGQNGNFTPPKSTVEELIQPTFSQIATGKHKLVFQTNRFSTIYVHPTRGYFAVLPLELLSFTGISSKDYNTLIWKTATEINFEKFELQRSKDAVVWSTIATISGKNNSAEINEYAYNDNNNLQPLLYYRLKMIDRDNTFSYSDIVKLTNNYIDENISIYPNPTENILNIHANYTINKDLISITNTLGKNIKNFKSYQINDNQIKLDISLLNSGVYYINIFNNVHKIIKK